MIAPMIPDTFTRDMIAAALRSVADEVCREHASLMTQEHQITSRLGEALERELRGLQVNGYRVEIVTQDIPDHGPGSLEKRIGTDLYIGLETRIDGVRRSKGLLVQAKKHKSLSSRERKDLTLQCEKMTARSDSSYVWSYSEEGVRVHRASAVALKWHQKLRGGDRVDDLISDVLACNQGDEALGLPEVASDAGASQLDVRRSMREAVGTMLERLGTRSAVGVSITDDR